MFNIISGVCSIIGLLVSLFTAGTVVKISNSYHCGNRTDRSRVVNKVKGSKIRKFIGGSSVHENDER